ncbi:MAG TPA: HlyD family efflux transporter periplasmic adaptor subunit [Gemmatimonadaceae bacterium]|jgi:HlyD family secretion protein
MRRVLLIGLASVLAACSRAKAPDAYGNIEATEVMVGSQASGQLTAFTPAEGDVLVAGAVAAVVDTSALVLQLEQIAAQQQESASRVDEAAKQIGVLDAQRVIALRNFERTTRLFNQQAATAQQLDQANRDYKTLIAQIAAARAQQRTASEAVVSVRAHTAQVQDQIRKASVVNPIAGTVLATYVKAGEIVQPGQALYKIANLDTMELRAYVTEPQLSEVKLGRTVRVAIDAGSQHRILSGVVSWVSSQAEFTPTPIETRDERSNLVYAVKVRIANPNGVLKIGMPADIEFSTTVASK